VQFLRLERRGRLVLTGPALVLWGDDAMEIDMRSRSMMVALLGVALALACIACDAGSPGSCTMTQTLGTDIQMICEEVPARLSGQLRATCNSSSTNYPPAGTATATYADGPCSRVGTVGGCTMTADGLNMTVWYYAGSSGYQTPDDLKQFCAGSGTYVAP
jgi:hypothetical protein